MSGTLYEVQDVAQTYDGRLVLDVPRLEVHAGEVLAIVGPSGAGKSTLLRLLNFLEQPQQGAIRFHGHAFAAGREMPLPLRRRVTTVFQRPVLLHRSVWSNVAYGMRLRGRRDVHRQVDEALETVGLAHLAHQRASVLSGGEAQRVALARALVIEPEVLLLDEPTANLDPYNVGLIEGIVTRLNQERGATVVVVTHNTHQAHRLAHRVGLLLDGRLVEVAESRAFFESPADPRTAAFLEGRIVY